MSSNSSDYYVTAPYYPRPKQEQWWLVLGRHDQNCLLAIKRITPDMKYVLLFRFPSFNYVLQKTYIYRKIRL
jgi:hypothetical protein